MKQIGALRGISAGELALFASDTITLPNSEFLSDAKQFLSLIEANQEVKELRAMIALTVGKPNRHDDLVRLSEDIYKRIVAGNKQYNFLGKIVKAVVHSGTMLPTVSYIAAQPETTSLQALLVGAANTSTTYALDDRVSKLSDMFTQRLASTVFSIPKVSQFINLK